MQNDSQEEFGSLYVSPWRRFVTQALSLEQISSGKISEGYEYDSNRVLRVYSDRFTIFGFPMKYTIPRQGELTVGLTHFNYSRGPLSQFPNNLSLNEQKNFFHIDDEDFRKTSPDRELMARSMLIVQAEETPYRIKYRMGLAGSAWNEYSSNCTVAGLKLPEGLCKYDITQRPFLTPSTRAITGQRINVSVQWFLDELGSVGMDILFMLRQAFDRSVEYALAKGLVLLDASFHVSTKPPKARETVYPAIILENSLMLDSDRFLPLANLNLTQASKQEPFLFGKHTIRDFVAEKVRSELEIDTSDLDQRNPKHRCFMANLTLPADLLEEVSQRNLRFFKDYTGSSLDQYQIGRMGLPEAE